MNKKFSQKQKLDFIVERKLSAIYSGVKFTPKNHQDMMCKFCGRPLTFILSNKCNSFVIKGCSCKGRNSVVCFYSIFGDKSPYFLMSNLHRKIETRMADTVRRLTRPWFVRKYGEQEGNARFEDFVNKSKQTEESMIKRHGLETGKKMWNVFLEKSLQTEENMIKRYGKEVGKEKWQERKDKMKSRGYFSQEYWIQKHGKEGLEMFRKNQTKNRAYFIEKYGEEEGEIRYKNKCGRHRFSNSRKRYEEMGENGILMFNKIQRKRQESRGYCFTSKPAKEMFTMIDNMLYNETSLWNRDKDICFGELKISLNTGDKRNVLFYDYCIPSLNLIIEFNGDYFHANPSIYDKNWINQNTKRTSLDIWKSDENKIKNANREGFCVIVVWERDWNQNKQKVIDGINREIENRRWIYGC